MIDHRSAPSLAEDAAAAADDHHHHHRLAAAVEVESGATGALSCAADSYANSGAQAGADNLLASLEDLEAAADSDRDRDSDWPLADAARSVSLVFWYKDDNPSPIYTLDARNRPAPLPPAANPIRRLSAAPAPAADGSQKWSKGEKRQNFARESSLAELVASSRHYSADATKFALDDALRLLVKRANASDAGTYKCRVDFRQGPTQSRLVRLAVKGESESLSAARKRE